MLGSPAYAILQVVSICYEDSISALSLAMRAIEVIFVPTAVIGNTYFIVSILIWLRRQNDVTKERVYLKTVFLAAATISMFGLLGIIVAYMVLPSSVRTSTQFFCTNSSDSFEFVTSSNLHLH